MWAEEVSEDEQVPVAVEDEGLGETKRVTRASRVDLFQVARFA